MAPVRIPLSRDPICMTLMPIRTWPVQVPAGPMRIRKRRLQVRMTSVQIRMRRMQVRMASVQITLSREPICMTPDAHSHLAGAGSRGPHANPHGASASPYHPPGNQREGEVCADICAIVLAVTGNQAVATSSSSRPSVSRRSVKHSLVIYGPCSSREGGFQRRHGVHARGDDEIQVPAKLRAPVENARLPAHQEAGDPVGRRKGVTRER